MPRVNAADLQRQGTELPRSVGSEVPAEEASQVATPAATETATEPPSTTRPHLTPRRAAGAAEGMGVDRDRVLDLVRAAAPAVDPVRSALNVDVDREVLRAFEALVREHRLTKRAVVEQLLRGLVAGEGT